MTYLTTDERIHALALVLQAEGPDEYPYGYYWHLAEIEVRAEIDEAR